MNRRPLGSTGIEVGEIVLGTWQLGNDDEVVAATDELWAREIADAPVPW